MPRDRQYDASNPTHDPRDPTTWDKVNPLPIDATGTVDVAGIRQIDETKQSGYAFAYLADILFDSVIRNAGTAEAPVPDTNIRWTTSPPGKESSILVEVSIDDGATWRECTLNSTVPGISAGAALGGRQLLCRQTFLSQDVGLASLRIEINYEPDVAGNPQQLLIEENTGALLGQGSLRGVVVDGNVVRPGTASYFQFDGANYIQVPAVDRAHISQGNAVYGEGERPATPVGSTVAEAFASVVNKTSCAIDFTFVPESKPGDATDIMPCKILRWRNAVYHGRDQGFAIYALDRRPAGFSDYDGWLPETGNGLLIGDGLTDLGVPPLLYTPEAIIDGVGDLFVPGRPYHVCVSYDGLTLSVAVNGRFVASVSYLLNSGLTVWHDGHYHNVYEREPGATPSLRDMFAGKNKQRFVDANGGKHDVHTGSVLQTNGALSIGDAGGGKCLLGDIRLWQRPLNAGDIARIRNRPMTDAYASNLEGSFSGEPSERGLAVYYRPSSAIGRTIVDVLGHTNGVAEGAGVPVVTGPVADGRIVSTPSGKAVYPFRTSPARDLSKYGKALYITNAPFNVVANGRTYQGVSALGEVQSLSENTDGVATRIELSLSGVRTDFVSTAMQAQYKDRPCIVYVAVFDPNGQLVASPVKMFHGLIDQMSIRIGSDSAVVSLSAESELVSWERQHTRRYNDASQQQLHPGDRGFEFVAELVDRDVWWPDRFSGEQTPPS